MADSRLPDVVPASIKMAGEESSVTSAAGWHISIVAALDNNATEPPVVVQIWNPSSGSCAGSPTGSLPGSPMGGRRSSSQHSDSGIESQLPSPSPMIDGNISKYGQQFVLDLSAQHLAVPSRATLYHRIPSEDSEPAVGDVECAQLKDSSGSINAGCDQINDAIDPPVGAALLPQHAKRNQQPNGLSPDRIRVDRAQYTAADEEDSEAPDSPTAAPSRHYDLSPTVRLINHSSARHSSLDDPMGSNRSVRGSGCSVTSQDSSSMILFSTDRNPRLSLDSSRQPSFSSVRSESVLEMGDERLTPVPTHGGDGCGKGRRDTLLSRSSSSRSALFLSVPTRIVNAFSEHRNQHSDGGNRKTDRHGHQQQGRRPSLHSQTDSIMSIQTRSFSPSTSPYLRMSLTDARDTVRDGHLYLAGDTGLITDDPYYSQNAAEAAALSLTQRLAFADSESRKNHGYHGGSGNRQEPMIREESSLNFFAKIITFLVLVFVIVLVVGVLVKSSHAPR